MPHRALANLATWRQAGRPAGAARTLQFAPLGFDVSFQEIFSTWGWAGTLVHLPRRGAPRSGGAAPLAGASSGSSGCFLPFVALQQLAEDRRREGGRRSALRDVITAGEQLRIDPGGPAFFARLTAPGCTTSTAPPRRHVVTALRAAGPPDALAGAAADRPADRQPPRPSARPPAGSPVPSGVAGELYVGGAGLARGYLGRPDLTAERFSPIPSAASRERVSTAPATSRGGRPTASWSSSAASTTRSRCAASASSWGRSRRCSRAPGVRDAAVVAREHRRRGTARLVAYVVAAARCQQTRGAARWFLGARLPEYMVPAAFVPLRGAAADTANGKLDRRALLRRRRREPRGAAPGGEPLTAPARRSCRRSGASSWASPESVAGTTSSRSAGTLFSPPSSSPASRLLLRSRCRCAAFSTLRPSQELAAHVEQPARAPASAAGSCGLPRPAPPPLSFAQERLWFLDRLDPGQSTAFNLAGAIELAGDLEIAALAGSFARLISRHEVLRTRFRDVDGEPCSRSSRPRSPRGSRSSTWAPSPRRGRSASCAGWPSERGLPFDLATGPAAARPSCVRLDRRAASSSCSLHHIGGDGWSLAILDASWASSTARSTAADPRRSRRSPSSMPTSPSGSASWLAGAEVERQLAYWRASWREPPTGSPAGRPAATGDAEPRRGVAASPSRLRALRPNAASAGGTGATLFMTLLAAFQALLYALPGRRTWCGHRRSQPHRGARD